MLAAGSLHGPKEKKKKEKWIDLREGDGSSSWEKGGGKGAKSD